MNRISAEVSSDGTSKVTAGILILLCVTVIYTTLLYGGADTGMITLWALSSSVLLVLWVTHAWKSAEVTIYYTDLYLPIITLLLIGLLQLLPLRNVDKFTEILGTPAAAS